MKRRLLIGGVILSVLIALVSVLGWGRLARQARPLSRGQPTMPFTKKDFWTLIDRVNRAALASGDEDGAVEPLIRWLRDRPEADIFAFEDHLARALYALDGRKYATESGEAGDSDDAFVYVRCYVVASGKAHYDAVLADPSLMPKTLDEWCEALLSVAREAYESQGKDWDYTAPVSYETGSNTALW